MILFDSAEQHRFLLQLNATDQSYQRFTFIHPFLLPRICGSWGLERGLHERGDELSGMRVHSRGSMFTPCEGRKRRVVCEGVAVTALTLAGDGRKIGGKRGSAERVRGTVHEWIQILQSG